MARFLNIEMYEAKNDGEILKVVQRQSFEGAILTLHASMNAK